MASCTPANKCWNCSRPASRQKCQGPGGTEADSKERLRIQRARRAAGQRGEVAIPLEAEAVPDIPRPVVPGSMRPTRGPWPPGPAGPPRPAPILQRTSEPADLCDRDEPEPEGSKQSDRPTGDPEAKRSKADHNESERLNLQRTVHRSIAEQRERDHKDQEYFSKDHDIYHEHIMEAPDPKSTASSSRDTTTNNPLQGREIEQPDENKARSERDENHKLALEAAKWRRQDTAVKTALAAGDTSSDESATGTRRPARSRTSYNIAEL